MVPGCAMTSRSKPTRLAPNASVRKLTPVMLPPGRFKLATKPASTGSLPAVKTMGMLAVAAFAACTEAAPPVAAITATPSLTRSSASAGIRSYWFSAQRYSISTLRPST